MFADCVSGWLEGPNKVYIPFLACGDLTGYDSDRSYPLPKVAGGTYQSLDPVQPPIAPPYKRALELKKASPQGFRELENLSLDSWSCISTVYSVLFGTLFIYWCFNCNEEKRGLCYTSTIK